MSTERESYPELSVLRDEALNFSADIAECAHSFVGEEVHEDRYREVLQNLNEVLRVLRVHDSSNPSVYLASLPDLLVKYGGIDNVSKLFNWFGLQFSSESKSVSLCEGVRLEDVISKFQLFIDYVNYLYNKHISRDYSGRKRKNYTNTRNAYLFATDLRGVLFDACSESDESDVTVPFGDVGISVERLVDELSAVHKGTGASEFGYAATDLGVAADRYTDVVTGSSRGRLARACEVQTTAQNVRAAIWHFYLDVLEGELKGSKAGGDEAAA